MNTDYYEHLLMRLKDPKEALAYLLACLDNSPADGFVHSPAVNLAIEDIYKAHPDLAEKVEE